MESEFWIPVARELPENLTSVLVCDYAGHWGCAWLIGREWCTSDFNVTAKQITHWAPIPPLPEEGTRA